LLFEIFLIQNLVRGICKGLRTVEATFLHYLEGFLLSQLHVLGKGRLRLSRGLPVWQYRLEGVSEHLVR
jgi:hypothetical protein